jgi:uncharacterized membrane protein YcgQ (UPF0703/DUF1980 family)
VLKDDMISRGCFICGRHVMTCCADDIAYSGIACQWKQSETLKSYDWVTVKGRIVIRNHEVYEQPGPVILIESVTPAEMPEEQVVSFY